MFFVFSVDQFSKKFTLLNQNKISNEKPQSLLVFFTNKHTRVGPRDLSSPNSTAHNSSVLSFVPLLVKNTSKGKIG